MFGPNVINGSLKVEEGDNVSQRDVWQRKRVRGMNVAGFAAGGEATSPGKQVPPEGNRPLRDGVRALTPQSVGRGMNV